MAEIIINEVEVTSSNSHSYLVQEFIFNSVVA
jgi:hypothetical protein